MDPKKIQSRFQGRVVSREDADYDAVRKVFPGDIDHKPAVIVRALGAGDVAGAIALARETKLPLSVRSGGHSPAGYGVVDNGITIDLREMKGLDIDDKNKSAWAETGLTAMEITRKLDEHNFVMGFGDTGSVGIGGITVCGGIGYLSRKYGLAIDNVISAQIVTADGKTLLIDRDNHPDLFWAIRGGGGNFGVVTKFQYSLHDLSDAYGGMLILPAAPETITGFLDFAKKAPDELSAIVNVMPAPPMPMIPQEHHGKIIIMAILFYAGKPDDGVKAVEQARKLAAPLVDMVRPMRYKDIFFPDDESYRPMAITKNFFTKQVDGAAAEIIIRELNASDATMRAVQLRVLGGHMSKVPVNGTAYAHRKKAIMVNVATFYTGPEDKSKRKNWVENLSGLLFGGEPGAYAGFIGSGENRINEVYPDETYRELVLIKKKYDPDNLFRQNVNITPT